MAYFKSAVSQSVRSVPDNTSSTDSDKDGFTGSFNLNKPVSNKPQLNPAKHKRFGKVPDASNLSAINEQEQRTGVNFEDRLVKNAGLGLRKSVQEVHSEAEIFRNSGLLDSLELTWQTTPRRSTSNKTVKIKLEHELLGAEGMSDGEKSTPRNKSPLKSLLKQLDNKNESIRKEPVLPPIGKPQEDDLHFPSSIQGSPRESLVGGTRERDMDTSLDEELRLRGLSKKTPCQHSLDRGLHQTHKGQILKLKSGKDVSQDRCVLCDIAEATVNTDDLDVEKVRQEIEYPQDYYDKYSRSLLKPSSSEGKEREVIPICKPVKVGKRPERPSVTPPTPDGPAPTARLEPEKEPRGTLAISDQKLLKDPAKSVHIQCRPKLNDIIITSSVDSRVLKGLKGLLLRKENVYKHPAIRDTKQTVYQVSSLGMAFSIPEYNNALKDRKLQLNTPPTPRSYINMNMPLMKFRNNDPVPYRSSRTAPVTSNAGTTTTPLPGLSPRQKIVSQPIPQPPLSLPPITPSITPSAPLSRLRL